MVTTQDHFLPEEGGWDHPIRGCHQACRTRLRQVLRRKESREEMSWMCTTGVLGVVMQEGPSLSSAEGQLGGVKATGTDGEACFSSTYPQVFSREDPTTLFSDYCLLLSPTTPTTRSEGK